MTERQVQPVPRTVRTASDIVADLLALLDSKDAKIAGLKTNLLLMAKLAKSYEEPQFYNPIEAMAAKVLRDDILEKDP